jgi:hypothetical protein
MSQQCLSFLSFELEQASHLWSSPILFKALQPSKTFPAKSAWDSHNNPIRWGDVMNVRRLEDLPLQGSADKIPWAGERDLIDRSHATFPFCCCILTFFKANQKQTKCKLLLFFSLSNACSRH